MPKPKNEWLHTMPTDWEQQFGFHGFGRLAHNHTYVVALSCLGAQYHISYHKDQREAAKAYDAALFCLLPFTSPRARPNFSDDFKCITLEDVRTLCPYAIELFNELSEQVRNTGLTVEALRKAREENLKVAVVATPERNTRQARAMRSYDQLLHRVAIAMTESNESHERLSAKLIAVDLRKLPAVSHAVLDSIQKLRDASFSLLEAHALLNSHREYFEKIKTQIIE